jgi:hypothetical protein
MRGSGGGLLRMRKVRDGIEKILILRKLRSSCLEDARR